MVSPVSYVQLYSYLSHSKVIFLWQRKGFVELLPMTTMAMTIAPTRAIQKGKVKPKRPDPDHAVRATKVLVPTAMTAKVDRVDPVAAHEMTVMTAKAVPVGLEADREMITMTAKVDPVDLVADHGMTAMMIHAPVVPAADDPTIEIETTSIVVKAAMMVDVTVGEIEIVTKVAAITVIEKAQAAPTIIAVDVPTTNVVVDVQEAATVAAAGTTVVGVDDPTTIGVEETAEATVAVATTMAIAAITPTATTHEAETGITTTRTTTIQPMLMKQS